MHQIRHQHAFLRHNAATIQHCCLLSCRAATALVEGVCGAQLLDAGMLSTLAGGWGAPKAAVVLAWNYCTVSVAVPWLVLAVLSCTHSGLLLGLLACADTARHAAFSAAPLNFTPTTVEIPAAGQA